MGRLRTALPAEWRRLINSNVQSEVSADRNSFHIFNPKTNEKIPTIKLTTKKIYDILIQKSDDNSVKRYQKWNQEFHSLIPWKRIWTNIYDNFSENKYCDTLARAPSGPPVGARATQTGKGQLTSVHPL